MTRAARLLIPTWLITTSTAAHGQTAATASERDALAEAQALCTADGGRLWGRSLCGPIMIVDPETREIVANRGDAMGVLHSDGGAFTGVLPTGIGIANTAVQWEGTNWTMVRRPLPLDRVSRAILLMHENWHRDQVQLGLQAREAAQNHLATMEGRIAMRLELRALGRAAERSGAASRRALSDALAFRAWRYARFPEAASSEAALELNEGLAEYTGWAAAGALSDRARLARHILRGEQGASLVRSFAYYTGPVYGLFLDQLTPQWRQTLQPRPGLTTAFPRRLVRALDERSFEQIGQLYGLAELRRRENAAAQAQAAAQAHSQALLVDGPTLTLPMNGANIVFDPNTVFPFGSAGNVYPRLQANGIWGTLEVTDGALLSSDWSALTIGAADMTAQGQEVHAPGWRLQLAPGWSVERINDRRWRLMQVAQGRQPIEEQP